MTNASLARKLARMSAGRQQAAGMVALAGAHLPALDPTAYLAEEQDRRREYLAEELLKIFAEEITWESAEDDATEQANATRAAVCAAHAALAAAAVLYPEIPEPAYEPRTGEAAGVCVGAQSMALDPSFAKGGAE